MIGDEVRDRLAHLATTGARLRECGRDVVGHAARPALGGVESDDADWR
jgi:hypothetical protein